MTRTAPANNSDVRDIARKLDALIDAYFEHIQANVKKYAKPGDLLKMIELKHKLLPDNSDQKQFWKMMQQLRKEQLPPERMPTGRDYQRKKTRSRKT